MNKTRVFSSQKKSKVCIIVANAFILCNMTDDLLARCLPLLCLSFSYTCPFVEKFSIDIETYYKPDTGTQNDVFNMTSAEKRQRDIGKDVALFFYWIYIYIMCGHF